MNFILLVVGFVILIIGGNLLLKSSIAISLKLNIPKIIIGMTVVSFATSAPELIVSLNAAIDGHADIALGNVIGSNIANLGLVLGIVTIIATISVEKSFYKINWPVMMLSSLVFYIFVTNDQMLSRIEGLIMFILLIVFLIYLLKTQKPAVIEEVPELTEVLPRRLIWVYLALGGAGLWAGSELLVNGAVNIAHQFGVSERVIGVTVVSVGTSIPELATSIMAIIKKEKAISLGNLIGSNVFNILAVLGITSMVTPIIVADTNLINFDIFWMLYFAIIMLPLVFAPERMKLSWKEGLLLLGSYIVFIAIVF